MTNIAGIILAAGESKRMGFPKPMLVCDDGLTLLEHQVELFVSAGIENIVVVVGAKTDGIMAKHTDLKVLWAVNQNWRRGQFSSLQTGIGKISEMEIKGAIVLPVDVIGIAKTTLEEIAKTALKNPNSNAIVPEYKSHDGHPVYISKTAFEKLLSINPEDKNSRLDVWLKTAKNVKIISVDDPAILKNVNTPEELNTKNPPKNFT